MEKGLVVVISGPSGVGKGTIVKELVKRGAEISVSVTTRDMRPGEIDGISYYFISKEEFENKAANGELLEYSRHFENGYGTPREPVEEKLARGKDVILEIDVNGGLQIKRNMKGAVLIMIAPPNAETLRDRLVGRNTETEDVISKRLSRAGYELSKFGEYDYVVVNDDLETAVAEVETIIKAEKLKVVRRQEKVKSILEDIK